MVAAASANTLSEVVTDGKDKRIQTVPEKEGYPEEKRRIPKGIRNGLVSGNGRQVQQGTYRLRLWPLQTGKEVPETVLGR